MKLLYGTSNQAKLEHMREMLKGLDIEIIGLKDIDVKIDDIDESGNIPLENARIKASAYYQALKIPVFSADSGLFIEGLEDDRQPGVHVRRVNGNILNDDEMIEYYANLATEFGGEVRAKYTNGICLIFDEETIFEYDGDDIASDYFLITSKPHPKRKKGYPLDSISVNIGTRKYYMDINSIEQDNENNRFENAFRRFFIQSMEQAFPSKV